MDRRSFGAVLLGFVPLTLVGGLVVASATSDSAPKVEQSCCAGFICPATGEELPCEKC
ncbi:MAG: hypothetical protein WD894_16680 [Pirellulales bacterium]